MPKCSHANHLWFSNIKGITVKNAPAFKEIDHTVNDLRRDHYFLKRMNTYTKDQWIVEQQGFSNVKENELKVQNNTHIKTILFYPASFCHFSSLLFELTNLSYIRIGKSCFKGNKCGQFHIAGSSLETLIIDDNSFPNAISFSVRSIFNCKSESFIATAKSLFIQVGIGCFITASSIYLSGMIVIRLFMG